MSPRPAVLLLAAALAVTGCGDDDGGEPDDGTTSSAVTSVDADTGDDGTDPDPPTDSTTTTTTSTTTTVVDGEAVDPPEGGVGGDHESTDDFVYVADLRGPGGDGRIEVRPGAADQLCVDMVVREISGSVTVAHLHRGAAGPDAEVAIPIGEPTDVSGATATWDDVCADVGAGLAEEMAIDATGFHADVHTAGHPGGAVSGQLGFATIFDLELS